ncbi:MAG: glycosyltransferase [Leptolyngbyaceae cyanobacterium RU_5_1]|nr:glycosyltransferase [Leptolyngbyaceae cyanobacterium RU_5_1]
MRLMIVQYAGDYREAAQRLANGGNETYYAQRYSVETVARLTQYAEEVSVLCCLTSETYEEVLFNEVRAIGAGFTSSIDTKKLIRMLEEYNPTHLILRSPMRDVLRWAIRKQIKILGLFAESVQNKGFRDRLRNFQLARLLNHQQVEWVGSYGLTSALTLQEIGVDANKIIPWDFLITPTPGSYTMKPSPTGTNTWNLLYVGSMSEEKGVGDCLRAVAALRDRNLPVCLKLVGKDPGYFAALAERLGISDRVEFLGMQPTSAIVPLMREADVVLVPSRHAYPEGFPLTIHHALCARTPIVASDHPMFQQYLQQGVSAVIFPEANAEALADSIETLFQHPTLYQTLSEGAYRTWYRLRLPVKWSDMLNHWVIRFSQSHQWLYEHRLASGQYDGNEPPDQLSQGAQLELRQAEK